MAKKRLLLFPIIIIALALIALYAWANNELHSPLAHTQGGKYVEIPRGSTPDEIISRLGDAGIIRRGWLLLLYIRLIGAGTNLKAGEYRFSSPISPMQVIKKLQEGEQRLSRLTIVEGWTRWDIAAQLARIPELKLRDADEALALMNDTSLIRDIDPEAKNLEGYLFPDTYSFPPDVTPKHIIETMVKRFKQVWGESIAKNSSQVGRTPREMVTVASLIETEAKLFEERPLVASVIYNRLRKNIPLGIDSTVIYASKLAGKWKNDGKVYVSDIARNSPYNTRKVHGLPPGPIASPGARSLEAALNPAQNDYLFYVRDPSRDDGAHNFYSNDSEFQRGVQALRDWERSRNANMMTMPPPAEKSLTPTESSPSPSP